MNTQFVIPAGIALSLHALIFLGSHSPRYEAKTVADPEPRVDHPIPVETWEDPLPAETATAAPQGEPDAPRSPEPFDPPARALFTLIVPPSRPLTGPINPRIPLGPIGVPDGRPGASSSTGIYSIDHLDQSPRARVSIAPVYPFEARAQGRPGEVVVEFVVDEHGNVMNPRVIRTSDTIFDSPTLRAVSRWKFEPGRKNGHAVRCRMALPVSFSVTDSGES